MTWLWTVPAALAGCGLALSFLVARRIAEETSGLRRDLGAVVQVRPAVVELRDEASRLGRRRPTR